MMYAGRAAHCKALFIEAVVDRSSISRKMQLSAFCEDIWIEIFSFLDMGDIELLTSSYFPQLSPLFCRAAKYIVYDSNTYFSSFDKLYASPNSSRLADCSGIRTLEIDFTRFQSAIAMMEIWSSFITCAENFGTTQLESLDAIFPRGADDVQMVGKMMVSLLDAVGNNKFGRLQTLRLVISDRCYFASAGSISEYCPRLIDISGYCHLLEGILVGIRWPSLMTVSVDTVMEAAAAHSDDENHIHYLVSNYLRAEYFPSAYRLDFGELFAERLLYLCVALLTQRDRNGQTHPDSLFNTATCIEFGSMMEWEDPFVMQMTWTDAMTDRRSRDGRYNMESTRNEERPLPTTPQFMSSSSFHGKVFENAFHVRFRDLLPSPHLMSLFQAGGHNARHFDPANPSALVFNEPVILSTDRVGDAIPRSWKREAKRRHHSESLLLKHNGIILQGISDDFVLLSYLLNTWDHETLPITALILHENVHIKTANDIRRCCNSFYSTLSAWKFRNICILHINDKYLRSLMTKGCAQTHHVDATCNCPLLCECNYFPNMECLAVELMTFGKCLAGQHCVGKSAAAICTAVDFIHKLHMCKTPLNWSILEYTLPQDRAYCEVFHMLRNLCSGITSGPNHWYLENGVAAGISRVFLSRKGFVCDRLFDIQREVSLSLP